MQKLKGVWVTERGHTDYFTTDQHGFYDEAVVVIVSQAQLRFDKAKQYVIGGKHKPDGQAFVTKDKRLGSADEMHIPNCYVFPLRPGGQMSSAMEDELEALRSEAKKKK